MEEKQGSHGEPPEIAKCLLIDPGYFPLQLQECTYLQVDLLGVGGLGGQGSIDNLLEGEGEDGGDPHAARGAHLPQVFIKIIK